MMKMTMNAVTLYKEEKKGKGKESVKDKNKVVSLYTVILFASVEMIETPLSESNSFFKQKKIK